MEKKCESKVASRQQVTTKPPCQTKACPSQLPKDISSNKKCPKSAENEELKDATCPVCMEYPHNAVLLICSSHNKGCRPYMCATSQIHSNCHQQFTKGHPNVSEIKVPLDTFDSSSPNISQLKNLGGIQLLCPLCRGHVQGWIVEEDARVYFNSKKRTCMQDTCSYNGNFKELKEHMKAKHPGANPRAADLVRAKKWEKLEQKRERDDVICAVEQSIPGAIVVGDYVIEPPLRGFFVFVRKCFTSFKNFNMRSNGAAQRRVHRDSEPSHEDGLGRAPPAPRHGFPKMLFWRARRH